MQKRMSRRASGAIGFSLIDLLATVAVFGTISAIAVPAAKNMFDNQRLGVSTRTVERELQTARLGAVTANQPIRVRFNCPAAKQIRRVELLGTVNVPASDDADTRATARCSYIGYPYPPTDTNPLSRPNHDGPIMSIDSSVSFGPTTTLEFWPNGTVHVPSASNPWPQVGSAGVAITLTRGSYTKTITVNSLGKIQIQ